MLQQLHLNIQKGRKKHTEGDVHEVEGGKLQIRFKNRHINTVSAEGNNQERGEEQKKEAVKTQNNSNNRGWMDTTRAEGISELQTAEGV